MISTNESTEFTLITGHMIYNPAYTYKFQLKTTLIILITIVFIFVVFSKRIIIFIVSTIVIIVVIFIRCFTINATIYFTGTSATKYLKLNLMLFSDAGR